MPRPNLKNTATTRKDGRTYRSLNITVTDKENKTIKGQAYIIRGTTEISLADVTRLALMFAYAPANRAALLAFIGFSK